LRSPFTVRRSPFAAVRTFTVCFHPAVEEATRDKVRGATRAIDHRRWNSPRYRSTANPSPLNGERRTANGERFFLLACLEETFELANAGWVAHLAERFGFDLTDSLAGDAELSTHLFKRSAVTVDQAEPLFENLPFAFG
jgi:hypothetical protein